MGRSGVSGIAMCGGVGVTRAVKGVLASKQEIG